ncbi:MAG: fused MFS/spermidine synthase [Planctomycetota bacterium]
MSGKGVRWDRLRTSGIIGVTCVCGWLVMELELLGARILVPYFGSSVYVVMGSVIGVFLLSLASGYVLGGWLSSKRWSKGALGANLIAAGAWLAVLPMFDEPVCEWISGLDVAETWGSLGAAFILFAVPTALLGTVSPTAVRWLTREAENAGAKAGMVLGFSTIASFAGTIATAFYLVRLSVARTIVVSGVIAMGTGIAVLLDGGRKREEEQPLRREDTKATRRRRGD